MRDATSALKHPDFRPLPWGSQNSERSPRADNRMIISINGSSGSGNFTYSHILPLRIWAGSRLT